jgi:hypothetical protein
VSTNRRPKLFDATVSQPKDSERVTFRFEVDATIGELRERERLANDAMHAALDGHGTTHTDEQLERAVCERAEAGFALQAAITRAQIAAVAAKLLRQYYELLSNPLKLFVQGRG